MIPAPHRGLRARDADRTVSRLRGLCAAVLTVTPALAAHAAGGGAVPSPSGIVLLLLAGSAAGWAAGPAVTRLGRRWSGAAVLGALLAGQGAGHLLLSLTGPHHGTAGQSVHSTAGHAAAHAGHAAVHHAASAPPHAGLPAQLLRVLAGHGGPEMLAAHLAATVVCAALLVVAESLYGPLVTAFRRLVPAAPPSAPAAAVRPAGPVAEPDPRIATVPVTPLTRRGPPRTVRPAPA